MKKLLALLLASLMLLSVLAGCEKSPEETSSPRTDVPETEAPAAPNSIYVAPDGDDKAAGTIDAPLATLDGARLKVRSLLPEAKEPVTVFFRGGDYYMEKGVVFDEADSGTETAPVTYKAYEGETVRFLGAKKVDPEKITPADDAFKARLNDEDAKASLLMADLSGLVDVYPAIYDFEHQDEECRLAMEVYLGDDPLVFSRWPNYVDDRSANNYVRTEPGETYNGKELRTCLLHYGDEIAERVATWSDESIAELYIFGQEEWTWLTERFRVLEFDREEHSFLESAGAFGGTRSYKNVEGGNMIVFLNLPEEIDEAGESYIDRTSRIAYFLPTEDFDPDDVYVSVLTDDMLTLNGTDYVTFAGLSFLYTRANVVQSTGSTGLTFENCVMAHTSERIGWFEESQDLHVDACQLYDTAHGIFAVFGGDRDTLESSGFVLENCEIHHSNRDGSTEDIELEEEHYYPGGFAYCPALAVYAVGAQIRHNIFHHTIHQTIQPESNNIVIEYNEFHDCLTECSDMGVIYYWNNPTLLGLTVRYNYFHDIGNMYGGSGTYCVYSDCGSMGADVYGNLFVRAAGVRQDFDRDTHPRGCILLGQFGHTHNNIFVDMPSVFRYGEYYYSAGTGRRLTGWVGYLHGRGLCENNKFTHSSVHNPLGRFEEVAYESEAWHAAYDDTMWGNIYTCFTWEMYEELKGLEDDAFAKKVFSIAPFQNNEVDGNVTVGITWLVNEPDTYRKSLKLHDNLEDADPSIFVDYENGDYNLTESGLALVRESCPDFEPLPLDQIGPRK